MDKDLLYDKAFSYLGTPHVNGGNIRGAGVDCCTLITGIYRDAGIIDIDFERDYPVDWFCRRDCKELILPHLERHFERVQDLKVGDVISFSWGRSKYAHLALYLGDNTVIHSVAGEGVELTDLENPYFYYSRGTRATAVWRLKKEVKQ